MRLMRILVAGLVLAAGCRDGGLDWKRLAEAEQAASTDSVLALARSPADGRTVHLVRLVASGDHYAFEPDRVRIRTGDVVRFVQTSHQPESVVFDLRQVPPGGAAVLRSTGSVAGPLLTRPGAVWDVTFEAVPPGTYRFASAAHAGFGMRGMVVVTE